MVFSYEINLKFLQTHQFYLIFARYPVVNGKEKAGELLVCFELFQIDPLIPKSLPELPPKIGSIYRLPNSIRPELKRTMIEV